MQRSAQKATSSVAGCGLVPLNRDGFEQGDRENFAPVYIGDSEDWVRPQFEVSDENPIQGRYSLLLRGDGADQRWLLASNAFQLRAPTTVSVQCRQVQAGAEFALLGAVERYSKGEVPRYALADAVRISGSDVWFELGANAAAWDTAAGDCARGVLEPGMTYRLSMTYGDAGAVHAKVVDMDTAQVLARFAGVSSTLSNGIGLFFHAPAGSEGVVQVDQVEVEYKGYELRERTWGRCPRFVIFKRQPDAVEDQGEWVGAASAMYDAEDQLYKLWYRIRRGKIRGTGYGYATSRDGIHWERYKGNPVLMYDKQVYSSTEKITVIKRDGQYQGWYTGDVGSDWHVVYVTSPDGIAWTQHGEVLTGGYFKDPDVVYVDGTYYMYLISPTGQELSVLTSADGRNWQFQAQVPAPCHVHVGAYYDAARKRFVLFQDAVQSVPYLRAAISTDGIHFGEFEPVLYNAPVGLDDIGIGVNYPTFYRDGLGHIGSVDEVVMLYQARHDYHNNRPGWEYAGDGKLVMGGWFRGARIGVPSVFRPREGLSYKAFPIHCPVAPGFGLEADAPVEFVVDQWDAADGGTREWTTSTSRAEVTFSFAQLEPERRYGVREKAGDETEFTTDRGGCGFAGVQAAGRQRWELNAC